MAANPNILKDLHDYVSTKIGRPVIDVDGDPPVGGGVGAVGAGPAGSRIIPNAPSKPVLMNIQDTRKISPTTGKPFKEIGGKTVDADPAALKAIIAHAKAKGLNPYDALAIAMQETEFGKKDPNYGSAWAYNADEGIPETDTVNYNASKLANALKEKVTYAAQLQKAGKIKPGESYALQAYNGYGDLRHNLMKVGGKAVPQNYYGVQVTGDAPMLMSQNPLYGKTIVSLRDEILKKHSGIKQLVDETPAYAPPIAQNK